MSTHRYPGDHASPYDMNRLADFYRDAAHRSSGSIFTGDPISAGPMRLLAIHSIELNLSAYLLLQGSSWSAIRRMRPRSSSASRMRDGNGISAPRADLGTHSRDRARPRVPHRQIRTRLTLHRLADEQAACDARGGRVKGVAGGGGCTTLASDLSTGLRLQCNRTGVPVHMNKRQISGSS